MAEKDTSRNIEAPIPFQRPVKPSDFRVIATAFLTSLKPIFCDCILVLINSSGDTANTAQVLATILEFDIIIRSYLSGFVEFFTNLVFNCS